MAEVELLRDGEEVSKQAWLKIDSRRLTLARRAGLGQEANSARQSVERPTSFERST
jgi:hypothetical protein